MLRRWSVTRKVITIQNADKERRHAANPVGADLMPLVFKAGRDHPKECKAVREDIDNRLREEIRKW